MALLVSSTKDLEKIVPREEAEELYRYVEMGGFLRIEKQGGKIIVVYPSRKMIRERLEELEGRRKEIIYQIAKMRRLENRKRLLDPLRIKHRLLSLIDSEYRDLAEKIEVERLFDDKRGRKIVETLQKSKEYRERLKEALSGSPVYKNRKFGEFVEKIKEVKGTLLNGRLKRLEEARKKVEEEMEVLRGLLRWVK